MAFPEDNELIDATVQDRAKALELLGVKPDPIARRNRLEETALHFLAVENFPSGVDFLCSHSADVNRVDFSNATPLLHAASFGVPSSSSRIMKSRSKSERGWDPGNGRDSDF